MGQMNLWVLFIFMHVVKCAQISSVELQDFTAHLMKTSQLNPTLKKGVEPEHDEDDIISDHAWEDSGKFEGDLILNDRQRRIIVKTVAEGLSRNGLRDTTKRWPNNEVIYYIQVEHFTNDQVQAIESGIDDLAQASCVKFRPYSKGDRDAVVIQGNRRGCFSQVGYQGGYQVLNLSGRHPVGRGCFRHGTVIHEMLHTLGFYHMQSSPDRDDYVDIIWNNIIQQAKHNFRKYNLFSVSDFGVGYDYDSVLHYSRRAFSSNGQDTIIPKKGGAQIGQRSGLSDKDALKLNKMYCDASSANSDNVEADDGASRNRKKKNKPFDGHGIGYHQGKAVVIKLVPSAETYKLHEIPSSHIFDYFSKTPHTLSMELEGFRADKEIAYPYNPSGSVTSRNYKGPAVFNTETQSNNKEIDTHSLAENKDEIDHTNIQLPPKIENNEKTASETTDDDEMDEVQDPNIIEVIDRISQIIKSRVYPSQTPDFSIYKKYGQYTKDGNDQQNDKKEKIDTSISVIPINYSKPQEDKMQSAVRYINNLFNNLDSYQSDKVLEDKNHLTDAKSNNYYSNGPEEKKSPETQKNYNNSVKDSPYIYSENGQNEKQDNNFKTYADGFNGYKEYSEYTLMPRDTKQFHDNNEKYVSHKPHTSYISVPYKNHVIPEASAYNHENIYSSSASTRPKFSYIL